MTSHNDFLVMREPFQIGLVLLLTFTVYLPGLQAGYFVFDDFHIIETLRKDGLQSIRLVGTDGSRYFRPLLLLTFLADAHLWNAQPAIMRLENLLLHIINTVLVFACVKTLLPVKPANDRRLPLLAAVLFGLHPVATESVNWIAARSDLLAAFFILAGFLLLIMSYRSGQWLPLCCAAFLMFAGALVKEVAVLALPGVILILLVLKTGKTDDPGWRYRLGMSLPFAGGVLLYTALRTRWFLGMDRGATKALQGLSTDLSDAGWWQQVHAAVTAFGFYVKKLLLPYPLNFAIDQVSPLYFAIGVPTLLLAFWILCRRDWLAGTVLLLALSILPAIINALYHIAWTPYAERYLYLPAAFLAIALSAFPTQNHVPARFRLSLILILLLSFLPQTLHRNLQWGEPITILSDALHRNPNNLTLRNNYAIVLTDEQGPQQGRQEFKKILDVDPTHQKARSNLARIALIVEDDPAQAKKDLAPYFAGELKPNANIASLMERIQAECTARKLTCD